MYSIIGRAIAILIIPLGFFHLQDVQKLPHDANIKISYIEEIWRKFAPIYLPVNAY